MRKYVSHVLILLLLGATVLSGIVFTRRAVPPTVGVDSPSMATLLVMLGGSRGILAEILWWRITTLQMENRFAELVPLTELLVTLEPTSDEAWVYNAWNLSYNISVEHAHPEERWEWVKRGIALLERGLRVRPTSELLLQQMGWTWEDKIGSNLDPASPYYRAHLSEISPPADKGDFEAHVGVPLDWSTAEVRALYWYERAHLSAHQVRVLIAMLRKRDQAELIPYYQTCVRQALPTLSEAQRASVATFTSELALMHPEMPTLRQLLQEIPL